MNRTLRSIALAPLACLLFAGCHVTEHKNGNNENVDIGTPFGSMQVKTNTADNAAALGLAMYPGAVPTKDDDDDDKDSHSANVNMSFGSFHLGVKAASFQTSDGEDKVLDFYRKDLTSRYGSVIECKGSSAVGTPTRTQQGLTCDEKGHTHVSSGDHDVELRSGSPLHQHIVGLEDHAGGTKIGLVALDLPSHLSDHDDKGSE